MQRPGIAAFATGIALAALVAAAVVFARRVPTPLPESAPQTDFSAARAMRHVRALAQGPRPAGSAAHVIAREYVEQELGRLGLTAQVHDAIGIGTRYAVVGRARNVLVRVPGSSGAGRGPAVLLVSHYDGVPGGPAASDAASGVAVLLETLRALRVGPALSNDVIALFTDDEEDGLLGAAAFVRDHPWAKDVGVLMNFEARGTFGPSFMFETGAGNLDVVRALRKVPGARATSLSTAVYRRLPNDTDLSELVLLDKPALNFAFIGGVQRYHTAEDDVAHLDQGSLQHHGNSALALARRFGNEPLPRPRTGDAVFFEMPLLGVIVYPVGWALFTVIVALVLVVLAVRRRRGERRLLRQLLIGALATVVAVALSAAAGYFMAGWIAGLHGAKPLGGAPAWSGVYIAAVVLLSWAIAAACHAIARRKASAAGVELGALVVWALITLLVTLAEPAASWLFVWPLIAAAAAALVPATRPGLWVAGAWIAAAIAIVVILPTIYATVGLALGLDVVGGTILALFTALGASLLAPHLETMSGTRPWMAPMIAAVAAVILFVVGGVTVRTNADQPVGVSLTYAIDADSSRAWFTGGGNARSARAWVIDALRESARGRGVQPLPRWLTRGFTAVVTVPAPFVSIAPPSAALVSDSTIAGMRQMTLRIRPAPGTLVVSLATDNEVRSVSVAGRAVTTDRYRRRQQWPLQYTAPPDTGFLITMSFRAGVQPTIGVMALMDTIPPLPGFRVPQRPAGVLPYQNGDVSLVYRRFRY
jgi:MFS family permease